MQVRFVATKENLDRIKLLHEISNEVFRALNFLNESMERGANEGFVIKINQDFVGTQRGIEAPYLEGMVYFSYDVTLPP